MLGMDTHGSCRPSPFLVPQPRNVQTVRILQPLVDYQIIKSWLTFCQERHSKTCAVFDGADPVSTVRAFRLIDCETRRIGPAPGQPYVTLSYLWGDSTPPLFSEVLVSGQPNTIEDAITATRALGFRYLWVDRYCINQQDKDDVRDQVEKMDLIYNNSDFTIIAAAGDGPDHGLPGVRPRSLQQAYGKVGKHFFVSTMDDPGPIIAKSAWMKRGWTYQEAVLSRRRLVFTDQQVYFECRGMYCYEDLNLPLENLHTKDQQHFKSEFCSASNMSLFPRRLGRTGWEVVERIEEYSRRTLREPKDILDAFKGVMSVLEKSPQQVRHCFGVPILPRPPKPSGLGYGSTDEAQDIYDSYTWSPSVGFCLGLCWNLPAGTVLNRRTGFPTWSWAGWIGDIKWGVSREDWSTVQGNKDLQVRVQLQNKQVLSWDEFELSYGELSPSLSPILHLSAWVTRIKLRELFQSFYPAGGWMWSASVLAEDGRLLSWKFTSTTHHHGRLTKFMAVHLARGCTSLRGLFVLVVFEKRPGVYQRCGFGEMTKDNLESMTLAERPLFSGDRTPPELKKSWETFSLE